MFNEFQLDDLEQEPFEFDNKPNDMLSNQITTGDEEIVDNEGAMAKADLFKLAKYGYKLFKKIQDDDQLEAWVQAKITKAADYIASVYHYLEYEMEFSEYGKRIENSDMYTEDQKRALKTKLLEAKQKLARVKIAQAKKVEENLRPKRVRSTVSEAAKGDPWTVKLNYDDPSGKGIAVCTKKVYAPSKEKAKSYAEADCTKAGKKNVKAVSATPVKSTELDEAKSKPSAGMTKAQKSAVVTKARAGKDIGKPGKGFEKVEAAAKKGGAKDPKAVAAAAMWKTAKKKAISEGFMPNVPTGDNTSPDWPENDDLTEESNTSVYTTTILNPNFTVDDDDREKIEVDVEYIISGRDHPGSWDEPPEYAEFELIRVTDTETGQEVDVDRQTIKELESEIMNQEPDIDGEPADFDYSRTFRESTVNEEVNTEEIQNLLDQLRAGEISYEEFRDQLDSAEYTDQSMRRGENGEDILNHRDQMAWDSERSDWEDEDRWNQDRDTEDDYDDETSDANSVSSKRMFRESKEVDSILKLAGLKKLNG